MSRPFIFVMLWWTMCAVIRGKYKSHKAMPTMSLIRGDIWDVFLSLCSFIFSGLHSSVLLLTALGTFCKSFPLSSVVNIFPISASFLNSRDIFLCNVQWKAIMLENIRVGFVVSVKSCCVLKSSRNEAEGMIWQWNKASARSPSLPQNALRRERSRWWVEFFFP